MTQLEEKIAYEFKDSSLLIQALTHSSYANESSCKSRNNERLEFLGDSVLGFISAEYFYLQYPDLPEGELTKMRAAEVCEKALCGYAMKIGLGEYLRLGKGEEGSGGRQRPSILADGFEALLAAVYLDGGIDEARKFVLPFIIEASSSENENDFKDYKTVLQEIIQQNPEESVDYVLVGETGPDHDKIFEVEVRLNSNVIGKGRGRSKKRAQQQAAREALRLMGVNN